MNPELRWLLRRWLETEEEDPQQLSALLEELGTKHPQLAPLARLLALKEAEEKALLALRERERWFRSFSWRMIGALFTFGIVGLLVFVWWGGEEAFLASIFFLAGGASFYLVLQAMATYHSHREQKARAEIQQRYRREREALRTEWGR